MPSALAKNKHQAVWVETVPLLFCVRCSSFPDGFARLELSALAEQFDAQIRVNPCRFCFALDDCMVGIISHVSALAERFDAQIRVEKTPCGSRAVCVGKK